MPESKAPDTASPVPDPDSPLPDPGSRFPDPGFVEIYETNPIWTEAVSEWNSFVQNGLQENGPGETASEDARRTTAPTPTPAQRSTALPMPPLPPPDLSRVDIQERMYKWLSTGFWRLAEMDLQDGINPPPGILLWAREMKENYDAGRVVIPLARWRTTRGALLERGGILGSGGGHMECGGNPMECGGNAAALDGEGQPAGPAAVSAGCHASTSPRGEACPGVTGPDMLPANDAGSMAPDMAPDMAPGMAPGPALFRPVKGPVSEADQKANCLRLLWWLRDGDDRLVDILMRRWPSAPPQIAEWIARMREARQAGEQVVEFEEWLEGR